ncbi:hypothetical protein BDZ97DRAFT_1849060 [Flammula alnicola]|nr:hypothetical protein BDZ97DRAFT_1849060 [Flammula alnicola]
MERINTDERTGTENMPGNYPLTEDSTTSGGYGATPDKIWSNKAQRGTDMPLRTSADSNAAAKAGSESDTGLIDQAVDGTDLRNELQDAKQGTDEGSFLEEDEWGMEKGAGKDF